MKKILIVFLVIGMFQSWATDSKSKITHVTIYRTNAKITRTASVKLSSGNNTITFGGLSTNILSSSIQMGMPDGVKLLSISYGIDYLKDKEVKADLKILNDSLEIITNESNWLYKKKNILVNEQALITENKKLGSTQEGVKVEELKLLDAFYNERMLALEKSIFDLTNQIAKLNLVKTRLQNQIYALSPNTNKTVGQIVAEVTSKVNSTVEFEFTYVLTNVSWSPIYDMYSDGSGDVSLTYKANVYQTTGIDWDNVPITISTGTPNTDNSRPILSPRYLTYYITPEYKKMPVSYDNSYSEMNIAVDKVKDVKREAQGTYEWNYGADSYVSMAMIETGMNVEFKVDQKYSIPADGKSHTVIMTEFKMPATYEYHTVPLKDQSAFLLAKVADWGKYNLLQGYANIFFDNTFIGQSYINPMITADTLLLSFGKDDRIIVKRDKVFTECSSKSVLGVKKHVFTYEITLRNTKSKAVSVDVLDQIPLSNIKEIEVELIDKGGADYNEKLGSLNWIIELKPGETKKLLFKYSVKHPKNQVVQNL